MRADNSLRVTAEFTPSSGGPAAVLDSKSNCAVTVCSIGVQQRSGFYMWPDVGVAAEGRADVEALLTLRVVRGQSPPPDAARSFILPSFLTQRNRRAAESHRGTSRKPEHRDPGEQMIELEIEVHRRIGAGQRKRFLPPA